MILNNFMVSIYYLTRARLLSERAHMHNIIKTCETLEATGETQVTLVDCDEALKSEQAINEFFAFHNVKTRFRIISLNSAGNRFKFKGVKIFTWLEVFLTNLRLIGFLTKKRKELKIIYFREHLLFPAASFARCFLKKTIFFESHYIWNNWYGRLLTNLSIKISAGVITISQALEKRFKKYNNNIITVFCAAPEFNFPKAYNKEKLRKELELPLDKTIIGYTGNMSVTGLGDSFGMEEVIESLKYLSEEFIFVGVGDKIGEAKFLLDVAEKQGLGKRVLILPWCQRQKVVDYLTAFDVLIIPKSGGSPGNVPTKTYEYLASNKPIVARATEPILEAMHDKENCLIVKTNSPQEWA